MNWSEIETHWHDMRALLASYWPELSESDLAQIDGRRDRLNRALQERYRLDPPAAEAAVCTFEKEVRRPGAVK